RPQHLWVCEIRIHSCGALPSAHRLFLTDSVVVLSGVPYCSCADIEPLLPWLCLRCVWQSLESPRRGSGCSDPGRSSCRRYGSVSAVGGSLPTTGEASS